MLSCIWKELQLLRLAAAWSKIARTSAKIGKTRLLSLVLIRVEERIYEQAFNWSLAGSVLIHFAEMTGAKIVC